MSGSSRQIGPRSPAIQRIDLEILDQRVVGAIIQVPGRVKAVQQSSGGGHFDTAFSAGGQWRVIFDLTLGFGRDFGDVSPIRGILAGGGRHDVKVAVNVSVL